MTTFTDNKAAAELNLENAFRAHQTGTAKYRAMEFSDAEWQASRDALTEARDAYEAFLFGGSRHVARGF